MSPRILRHSWLAIGAPFFALGIARAADGNWRSAILLFTLGCALILVELIVVLRVRLRNPFYRLRTLQVQSLDQPDQYNRLSADIAGYSAKIIKDCELLANYLLDHERALIGGNRVTQIARRRELRLTIKQHEEELCKVLSEFRGFFYAPD
jgi:hypothetical protein